MLKIEKSGVYLDEQEMMELETVIFDEDAPAALEFLKRLKKKIEVQQRHHCGSKLVRGE
jgi:hypothetical protein